ncbi:MAG: Rpn family recombination-promoting nuclease/putative transposase [Treponema sp.]|jgi:hypothetical protein|nr:Rpn family recombination-promoting nuclease/putative transposase [Treponema sp.]
MGLNRQYKDSVFSFLFSDPAALRELYGAIAGIELPPDIPITLNTLEGVLYKTLLNDISFEVGNKLVVLIEHQSTINPNMTVRLLMYIARVYEKMSAGRNLYGRKKFTIPRPEFIVLYNGMEPYPDEAVLKLSEAFENPSFLGISQNRPPDLELTVKVYNINQGCNEPIIRRCEKLEGYSALIAKVREFEAEIAGGRSHQKLSDEEKEEAMTLAVRWCIAHNVLKPFLEFHGSEVVNMLMTEWKLEDALIVEREEGREKGLEEGRFEVAKNALKEGLPLEVIQKITGLDLETLKGLQ